MAVGGDHAAVQARVRGVGRWDHLQLRGDEVRLHKAVLLIQTLHHRQLDPVLALALHGLAAHQQVQLLAGKGLAEGLLVLLRAQVGQQIADEQLGLVPLAQDHGDHLAVLEGHHAVDGQRDGHPLVLADAAVVVGLQVGQLVLLIEGSGLQVQPGAVHVGGGDVDALGQALLADDSQHQHLAPVVHVHLVSRLEAHAPLVGPEALGLGQPDPLLDAFPLGLAGVQVCLVVLAVGVHGLPLPGGQTVIAVLPLRHQLFLPLFHVHFAFSSIE